MFDANPDAKLLLSVMQSVGSVKSDFELGVALHVSTNSQLQVV